jgi:hypothetical protein
MPLSIRHQWSLRRIETSLRRSDRQFAILMSALSAFALTGKMPEHERLTPRSTWGCRLLTVAMLRLMLLCADAARLSWFAIRWLAAELKAVLGTGKDLNQAAGAGTRRASGAGR